jgi:hypothetical protein
MKAQLRTLRTAVLLLADGVPRFSSDADARKKD